MLGLTDGVVGTGMLKFVRLGAAAEDPSTTSPSASALVKDHPLVVFSSRGCPYCGDAIDALHRAGLSPTVVEVTSEQRRDLHAQTGQSSVPSVWVRGQFIGGAEDGPEEFEGVHRSLASGKLQELLEV
eukprot:TRINITY_DN51889_c0_g2_i1.p1 TRINITY_DN51889_c0_g2~~TRINITY_DN51889_c0_g2_i1.p1  ORF type:complete len:128 (-),score=9.32 TRINITY_DN51889_c0_g2_i1:307-690(-)